MEIRAHNRWLLVAFAVAVNIALVLLLTAGAQPSDAAPRTSPSCTQAVRLLRDHLAALSSEQPGISPKITRTSLRACATPDAWRVRAEKVGIGAALGKLLGDPGLATDRALDTLCTHFDQYETTRVCRAHEGASLSS